MHHLSESTIAKLEAAKTEQELMDTKFTPEEFMEMILTALDGPLWDKPGYEGDFQ